MHRDKRRAGRAIRKRRRVAAGIERGARRLGVELMPWQLDVLVAAVLGEPLVFVGGRRAGRTIVGELAPRVVSHERRGYPPLEVVYDEPVFDDVERLRRLVVDA